MFCFAVAILRQRTADVNIKKFAIQHLDKLGSLDVASKKLIELRDEIMADIENFGGNPGLNNLMQLLYLDDSELKRLEKSFEAESNA